MVSSIEQFETTENMNNAHIPARKLPQYVAALAATGGALAAGTLLGWTSPTESLIVDKNGTEAKEYGFVVGDEAWSWVGSSTTLGAAIMCLFIGTIINLCGRKLTMLLLVIPFTIGWALVIWASNIAMLIVGRTLLGISGGSFCICAPMYIGEIAQKDIRGTLGTFFQLMLTIGILFVYAVGSGASVFVLSIVCGCIPIIFAVIFVFMPESPYYWVSKKQTEKAVASLKWLRGDNYDYNTELQELQSEHEERENSKISFAAAFARRTSVKALIIMLGLMFFQQMSGINAVIFYTGFIFDRANTGIQGSIATIIVGVMQVIATFVSSIIVDKLGRRILLLISVSVMALCTIVLGIYFYLSDQGNPNIDSLGWLPIVAMCVFIVVFSLGFGPIPWLMVGEIFPADVKGLASSICGAFNWALAFVITKTFTNIREAIGIGETFWLFSAFSVVGTVFVFFVVPETKGKSLSDIQKMLAGEKPINNDSDNHGVMDAKL
ncbi:facilitated trehalose transporter Tret1-like isoform X2 [Bradysia coprophila]|uniref:facilitated trehalose transporter Tret1-like isoform X2 n=1 Tax=Bradysia coprophila TaxID=38358 RepID=UPI00187DD480|nr:facilitated trehalose transporter Tret1-like isoform X2 [Bradysia coprophila]